MKAFFESFGAVEEAGPIGPWARPSAAQVATKEAASVVATWGKRRFQLVVGGSPQKKEKHMATKAGDLGDSRMGRPTQRQRCPFVFFGLIKMNSTWFSLVHVALWISGCASMQGTGEERQWTGLPLVVATSSEIISEVKYFIRVYMFMLVGSGWHECSFANDNFRINSVGKRFSFFVLMPLC